MKKTGGITELVLPILGCIIITFVFVSFFLHFLLDQSTTTFSRTPKEDIDVPATDRGFNNDRDDDGDDDGNHEDFEDIISKVKESRISSSIETFDDISYDINKCPPDIPKNYPFAWSILDVLGHWNPDDTEIPSMIHQGLCTIDWKDPKQRKIAVHYRKNEFPFLVKNHPQIWKTASKWANYDYLLKMLGKEKLYRNEYSTKNHMMYWKLRGRQKGPDGWQPPTKNVELSFPDWYEKAEKLENIDEDPTNNEHFYLRLNGAIGRKPKESKNLFLYDDLPFFSPEKQSDIFMVDPSDARGINCRLGSKGVIAEAHYDMSRNFILMLRGRKRYILAHPSQCINMELYPLGHPSARHSRINWSDPESWQLDGDHFQHGQVNEIVLQAGDALYLPTFWFHFIVSLSLNYQCNARSGITLDYQSHIKDCGF